MGTYIGRHRYDGHKFGTCRLDVSFIEVNLVDVSLMEVTSPSLAEMIEISLMVG